MNSQIGATVAAGSNLDTVLKVTTPEGIELALHPAGPVPRVLAWLIDLVWRFAVLFVLLMFLPMLGDVGQGIWLLVFFLLDWLVPAWFEARRGGATPGKKALGLMVLRDDGAPAGWNEALTRNLLRFADFLPLMYMGGLLSMIISPGFKRLGDHAAGTLVVHKPSSAPSAPVPSVDPEPPPAALDLAGRRALLDYAERYPQLTTERAEEIAAAAAPMLAPDSRSPAQRLLAMANHLLGRARSESGSS